MLGSVETSFVHSSKIYAWLKNRTAYQPRNTILMVNHGPGSIMLNATIMLNREYGCGTWWLWWKILWRLNNRGQALNWHLFNMTLLISIKETGHFELLSPKCLQSSANKITGLSIASNTFGGDCKIFSGYLYFRNTQ